MPVDHSSSRCTPTAPVILEEDWGDDAVMQWDGPVDLTNVDEEDADESASSVAPEDAGLSGDEDGEWGREAMMGWGPATDEDEGGNKLKSRAMGVSSLYNVEDEEEEEEEQIEERNDETLGIETAERLRLRGMPDYSAWNLKKLQVSIQVMDRLTKLILISALDGRVRLSSEHESRCPR